MTIRLSVCAIAVAIFGFAPIEAQAQCDQFDHACQKFSKKKAVPNATRRRSKQRTNARRRSQRTATRSSTEARQAARSPTGTPVSLASTPVQPSIRISAIAPSARLTVLKPGAIREAPRDLPNLQFGAGDQIELTTGKCRPVERSKRRISCAIAQHRLAMTSEAGAGCVGSLALREIEFVQNEEGGWVSEDSIALCGGRLLRRTELFPVTFIDTPRYALREEYQLLGGDQACAAPYLRSRQPLRKSYLPIDKAAGHNMQCGTVASR